MAGRSDQSAEKDAARSFWARAKRLTACAALGLLVVVCSQWCANAVAGYSVLAARGPDWADSVQLAAVRAENAWLAARSDRLARMRSPLEAAPAAQAERRIMGEFRRIESVAQSAEARAIAAALRLSLERWSNERDLPEAYGAFAAAMEEARAEEIARQFRLLAQTLAADTAADDEAGVAELSRLRIAASVLAYGGPAVAVMLLLIVVLAERAAFERPQAAAGVIVLDAEARVVYADETASRRFARNAQPFEVALRALDAAVVEFRNGEDAGECLIAGLESGDTVRGADGRKLQVQRRTGENGGAVLTMSETRRGATA